MILQRGVVLFAALLFASCGSNKPEEQKHAALGGEIAARVGTDLIPVALVEQVASEQKISLEEARRRLIDDAIAAEAARARGLDHADPASWLLKAARARFTADRLRAHARAAGPPTDDEVRALSELHWREVDRPPSVRVQHALAKRAAKPTPASDAEARALATTLHEALVSAKTDGEFRDKAKAVAHPNDIDVVVEDLPPFTDEGRLVEGSGAMETSFVKGAIALAHPGDVSGVIESPFGWHVIRLVERLPEQRMPFETRRIAFADEAYARRARTDLEARLAVIRQASPVSLSTSAEQLMRSVAHEPPP